MPYDFLKLCMEEEKIDKKLVFELTFVATIGAFWKK